MVLEHAFTKHIFRSQEYAIVPERRKEELRTKGIFLVAIVLAGMMLTTTSVPVGTAASPIEMDNAIDKGLAYLNRTQKNGYWSSGDFPVASTAMAVLAFENAPNSHYGWNSSDPYNTTVQNGLDWLFSQATVKPIDSSKSAGNPDNNTNGIGIGWYGDGQPVYETPMVLMAIIASNAPSNVSTTGKANVTGRTYYDIAQDVVDWIAWAQNSITANRQYEGGWRYNPQQSTYSDGPVSDNSISQWPIIGLLAAELWGINASAWVGTELLKWTNTTQSLAGNNSTNYYGSFDYSPGVHIYTPAETAAGILELTYCGINDTDPRIVAAEGYLNRDWNPNGNSPWGFGWNWNIGDLYDMYAVMKACMLTTPNATVFIANYDGTNGVEWYNGTGEYADALLANQGPVHGWPDGAWNNWVSVAEGDDISFDLGTSWGTLILEYVAVRVRWNLSVHVVDANTNSSIAGANATIEGPVTNSNMTDGGTAVFNQIQAGLYTVSASKAGYAPVSVIVSLTNDTEITIKLTLIIKHDVAVTDVSPDSNWIYQGILCHCAIKVTITNRGSFAEGFPVAVFAYNDSSGNYTVGTQSVTGLQPSGTVTLTFVWNTIGVPVCHWYNITAVASLGDDVNPSDNILSSPVLVKVRIIGDVNGDGEVSLSDIVIMAEAYSSSAGYPRWNDACDINNDGKVDLADLVTLAIHYRQHCP